MISISEENGINILSGNEKNILSIGISTNGNAEIKMSQKCENGKIIATSIDNEGIKEVTKKVKELNLEDKILIKYEDVRSKTNYTNNYFDYIYARLVLHYLNNQELIIALKELNRILKEEGKIFIVVRSENAWETKTKYSSSYDEKSGLTKMPDLKTINSDEIKYYYRRLHSSESISEFLTKNNFDIISLKKYKEYLSPNFDRTNMNEEASELIEVIAKKIKK